MPRSPKATRPAAPTDPNKLVRQKAGTYRTADERFEVRQAGIGWFLVDSEGTNDFGQELVRGPFATLADVRTSLPDARRTTLRSLPRPKASRAARATPPRATPPRAPAPPPSWIARLPKREAASVRAMIRALDRQGLPDPEELVKADRGRSPVIAARLLEQRMAMMIAELPAVERDPARRLIRRVVGLLTADGTGQSPPLPGWTLVELGPEPEPPNRRIVLRKSPPDG